MRYFLELDFNGAVFHGWQSQPNAVSVQSTLEDALSKLLGTPTQITGAGRTDTGVNARQMFAHFDSPTPISDIRKFLLSANSMVGRNIGIKRLLEVQESAHARFDASERTYKYFVTFKKNPFLKDFCWYSSTFLDMSRMNEAAEILLQTDDFTSFAKLHSDAKTNLCDVREAKWTFLENDKEASEFLGDLNNGIVFTITANRFLRNMVRSIVGTLVDVGRGKLSIEDFHKIILCKDRCAAGTSMPAHALFLWRIKYPDSIFINS